MESFRNYPYKPSQVCFKNHWDKHALEFVNKLNEHKTIHWGYRDIQIPKIINNEEYNCKICDGKINWFNHLNDKKWQGFKWGIEQLKHISSTKLTNENVSIIPFSPLGIATMSKIEPMEMSPIKTSPVKPFISNIVITKLPKKENDQKKNTISTKKENHSKKLYWTKQNKSPKQKYYCHKKRKLLKKQTNIKEFDADRQNNAKKRKLN